MNIIKTIKSHLDDGDCKYCPMYFTMSSFILGVLVGLLL